MKILFLTARLNPNQTSCGLLATKLLHAMAQDENKTLVVLTFDKEASYRVDESNKNITIHILDAPGFWKRFLGLLEWLKISLPFVHNKINALSAYVSGYSLYQHAEITGWRIHVKHRVAQERFDLVFCYGSGQDFNCHIAMTSFPNRIPWLANYHDPYPGSLYPEPYRVRIPVISGLQERRNRKIVESARYLSFPSKRLADWQLGGSNRYDQKVVILPHVGISLPANDTDATADSFELDAGCFCLLHTGTLLTPRDPRALLRAFSSFVAKSADRRKYARLVFIGKINKEHAAYREWEELQQTGCFRMVQHRVNYMKSLALCRQATVLVSIEAKAELSPFFPGKIADYIFLDKPILALSPKAATVVDLLGEDYPHWAEVGDQNRIESIIEELWNAWRANPGSLALNKPALREYIGAENVNRIVNQLA